MNRQAGYINNVLVCCGAREGNDKNLVRMADNFAFEAIRNKFSLVYGGGYAGLMGVIRRGAERAGGRPYGITTSFLHAANDPLHSNEVVEHMHERKSRMIEKSDASVFFPGGFGTLDELFEILCFNDVITLTYPDRPIIPCVLLNHGGAFDGVNDFIEKAIKREQLPEERKQYLWFVNDEHEMIETLLTINRAGPAYGHDFKFRPPEADDITIVRANGNGELSVKPL